MIGRSGIYHFWSHLRLFFRVWGFRVSIEIRVRVRVRVRVMVRVRVRIRVGVRVRVDALV